MKFDDEEQHDQKPQPVSRPPLAVDVLTIVAEEVLQSSTGSHESVPRVAPTLARWWMHQQEPPHPFMDRPQSRSRRDGGTYWLTPYADRIAHTLREFMRLNADFQGWIVAAREDGIFWRGEDREQFRRLIIETEKFNRLCRDEYVKEAKSQMKIALAAMAAK